ncbi:MAG: AraC family transcriptional regulator [Lentisphaeria bacterium]|nr:AraC family transcriptional regulator [Lentisphaeria bacterium]
MKRFRDFHYSLYSGNLGFFVRAIGFFQLHAADSEPEKDADFAEIFWTVSGEGVFSMSGREYILPPGYIWYYPSGSHHRFHPRRSGEGWAYRWLSIEGQFADSFFKGLGIKPGLNRACPCPEQLFREIELNIEIPRIEKRLETLDIAFRILTIAAGGRLSFPKRTGNLREIRTFIDENFFSPELNVERLADLFSCHRVVLSRRFKEAFGVGPANYIATHRLQKALKMLRESNLPMSEIAAECGFSSPIYFNKVIRKATGQPPGRLRGNSPASQTS